MVQFSSDATEELQGVASPPTMADDLGGGMWSYKDHSAAANDAMVAKVKGMRVARKNWRKLGSQLTAKKALYDFAHRPTAGTLAAAVEDADLSDLFTKVLLPKVKPPRFGELVVRVDEVTHSETRRDRWLKATGKVTTKKAFVRPPSPLNSKTGRMWSESGEVPVRGATDRHTFRSACPCPHHAPLPSAHPKLRAAPAPL